MIRPLLGVLTGSAIGAMVLAVALGVWVSAGCFAVVALGLMGMGLLVSPE